MSTIKGPFDFTGSFGNIRCYEDTALGKRILSRKGGPTRDQFLTHPKYARQREFSKEFGGRSKWASMLKATLSDVGHLMYARCFNQIMIAGNPIQQRDLTGKNGFRAVVVKNDPGRLLRIDFNERRPFSKVLSDIYMIGLSPDKRTVTLTIPRFIPSRDLWWVSKFFAVRFYLVIAQIADVAWNPVTEKYEPVVSDLDQLTRCVKGNWIIKNSLPVDVALETSFDLPPFSLPGTSMIVAMGVEIATSLTNGVPNPPTKSGTMAIVGCYTE
jgi:hypothetical protein